jgi:macrolide-specific efflux system membrane fusion protein
MALQAYEVELSQIALEEQKLKSSKVETAIQDAQIIAPLDGRLLTSRLTEGQTVKAFDAVAIVGDDTQLEIGAKLISTQMELLSEGMDCIAAFTNRPDEGLPCGVRQMPYPYGSAGEKSENSSGASGVMATNDTNTRITVDLPAGTTLKMSDMVSITVILENKSGVLWLPPSAIRSFEGRNFVVVQAEDAAPRRVDIKVGLSNDDMVEVLEGLEEGQIVIAP